MKPIDTQSSHRKENGFTLLEVLVALVVLSIGLLGLAGLQASGLSNNNNAMQRTQATLLAYDMLDRMRANFDGVRTGLYNNMTAGTASDPSACFANVGGCSAQQIADYDNYDWGVKLGGDLPAGTGKVVGNGIGSTFTITVMWDESRTGATGTNCSGNAAVDLTCFSISSQI